MTRLPLNFPPLRELAVRAAQEHTAAFRAEAGESWLEWACLTAGTQDRRIGAFARLLSDLTHPASQAMWLPWLAERVGVRAPPVGTPRWGRYRYRPDRGLVCFELSDIDDTHEVVFGFGFGPGAMGGIGHYCPALPDPDSPDADIRALVLAILTVGGAR